MAIHLESSVLGILEWMKERQSAGYVSLADAAAHFGVGTEHMRRNLQWLQRYECVRRGGVGNAEWSITALGLVRLSEGRFSRTGAFLSPYEHPTGARRSSTSPERPATVAVPPVTTDNERLGLWTESTVTLGDETTSDPESQE